MLIKAIVDNFLSFENETTLTMIPSNKTRKLLNQKIEVKNTSLLKYAVIYGANAAGKSNLVEVFSFMKYCIMNSIPMKAATKFCKAKAENENRPSLFEMQFSINDKFYAYGFTLLLKDRSVKSEWLYELFQNGSQKTLFEREEGKKPVIGDRVTLSFAEKTKLQTYIDDFDENSNLLFLNTMNRGKKYTEGSNLFFFKVVFNWIVNNLYIATPQTSFRSFEYYYDDASLSVINNLIQTFDTGITKIDIVETTMEDFKHEIPEEIYHDIMDDIRQKAEDDGVSDFKFSMRSNSVFYNLEFSKGNEPKITTISLKHGNSFFDFKYGEESDGTRRLFDLLDMILNKSEDAVYVIDEMERSLHPKLTAKFIELFEQAHKSQKTQLVFTTHESSIMDQELFRRDEIWFVERGKDNDSRLYSLDKFKERYDKKLSKAYLEGRYGAIPVFSTFKFEEV